MKQLIQNLKTGRLDLKEVPYPLCKPRGVVIRTVNSLISAGTEKSIIELSRKTLLGKAKARPDLLKMAIEKARKGGYLKTFKESLNRLDEPFPLGYSASGIVVEVGKDNREFSIGDRVGITGSGYANHAEYNFVPQNLCVGIPQRPTGEYLDYEETSFCMLGGIAIQGIREGNLTFGESVAVVGLGLLGLLTIQILKAIGCDVIGIDIDEKKCRLAKQLGCDEVFVGQESVVADYENKIDAVLIATATKGTDPLETAEKIARQRGRIVLVGTCDIKIDRKYFWDKELEFRVSKAAGPGIADDNYELKGIDYPLAYVRWPEKKNMEYFLKLLAQDKVDVKQLITHRFSIDEAISAYDMIMQGKQPYIGVVLKYQAGELPGEDKKEQLALVARKNISRHLDEDRRRNVGFIGGGMFTKNILLPALVQVKNVNLVGIATSSGISADHLASKFDFNYSTTDYTKLLEDDEIGSVFVTTRHNLHAKMVIESLEAGKDVFVEKPLCLNREELEEINKAYKKTDSLLMVGFNRRYSRHALDIKSFFENNGNSFVINYRVNAGYIEDDHWTHDSTIGGGRIVGEVCHFVDFLQFITNSRPVDVYAESITAMDKYRADDNIIITIKFHNGSIGTITYTSQGSKSYPREIVEIFRGGSVYYLEDFKRAVKVSNGKRMKKKLVSQDMGHKSKLECFLSKNFTTDNTRECFNNSLAVFGIINSLKTGRSVSIQRI